MMQVNIELLVTVSLENSEFCTRIIQSSQVVFDRLVTQAKVFHWKLNAYDKQRCLLCLLECYYFHNMFT